MEFYLIHNLMVELPAQGTALTYDSKMVARSVDVPVEITHKDGNSFTESCCEELRRRVRNAGEKCLRSTTKSLPSPASDEPEKNGTVILTLAAKLQGNWLEKHRNFVQLVGAGRENLLTGIESVVVGLGYKFALTVKIYDFTHTNKASEQYNFHEYMEAEGSVEDFARPGSPSTGGCPLIHGGIIGPNGYWTISATCTHRFKLSVIGCIKPKQEEIGGSIFSAKPVVTSSSLYKFILDHEIQTDTVANVSEDFQIKCHRAILCAQSSVFRAMFKDTYEESKTGIIHIEDMSEAGVRAFLEFLYYFSISKPSESFGIAVELFKAGHKYDVERLETEMSNLILAKEVSWFDLENTVTLFRFLKHLDGYEGIKLKAVKYLKANFTGFKNSGSFKKMFHEEPDAAMELCELLCKADLLG